MIVSPPKAGKTTILKQIAHSIEQNDPSVHLMVLLVDERPEEVDRLAPLGEGRGDRLDLRPSRRRAHDRRRARHRAGQAARRARPGRRDHPRRHHPSRPGLQPRPAGHRPHHVRWRRLGGPLPAEEVLRRRPQHRRGRLAHDPRHRARRDGLEDGRGHLRGVQGHGQHGAPPRPQAGRAQDLPGDRRQRQLDTARGAALRPLPAPAGLEAAPGAERPRRRRRPRRRPRAARWTRSARLVPTTSSSPRSPRRRSREAEQLRSRPGRTRRALRPRMEKS